MKADVKDILDVFARTTMDAMDEPSRKLAERYANACGVSLNSIVLEISIIAFYIDAYNNTDDDYKNSVFMNILEDDAFSAITRLAEMRYNDDDDEYPTDI